jgi:hypothetical protein
MADERPWYSPDLKQTKVERLPRPTTHVWTLLRIVGDSTASFACELVDGAPVGSELRILRSGELYRSELISDLDTAVQLAETYRQAALAAGWKDVSVAREG